MYTGQFRDDKREGKGFYKWIDGSTYKGEWSRDRMHGIGYLVRDTPVLARFSEDRFVRTVEEAEVGDLGYYIF